MKDRKMRCGCGTGWAGGGDVKRTTEGPGNCRGGWGSEFKLKGRTRKMVVTEVLHAKCIDGNMQHIVSLTLEAD
jgi:hypothetical protein